MPDVNLNPYSAEQAAIDQRRKLAEMLQAQANQPQEINQMAGGYVIPLPKYSGLFKVLQSLGSSFMNMQANKQLDELAQRQNADTKSDYSALIRAMSDRGEPGKAAIESPPDELGGGPGRDAIAGRTPMLQTPEFMASLKTPQGQQTALQLAMQRFAPKESPYAKLDPSKYTKESIQDFAANGAQDYSKLVPIRNLHFADTGDAVQGLDPTTGAPVGSATPKAVSPDKQAGLSMDMFRWLNLSPEQKQKLEIMLQQANTGALNAANRNIQTQFETGNSAAPVGGAMPQSAPQAAPGGVTDNNFGNIRPVGGGPNSGFMNYPTPQAGLAALQGNLRAYGNAGVNTLSGIISKWAPPNENNTAQLIKNASQRLGIDPNQPLDMKNPQVIDRLTEAIVMQEKGPSGVSAVRQLLGNLSPVGNAAAAVLPPKAQTQIAVATAEKRAEMEQKRDFNMSGLGETIDSAKAILTGKTRPTNSYVGTAVDAAGSLVGYAPAGAAEADKLRAIGGVLVAKMPRMEGPQSDKDVMLYREMAGRVGDSTLPIERRKAALEEVESLWRKYDKSAPTQNRGATGGWSIRQVN